MDSPGRTMRRYDAVIVGAGPGGLTAASALAAEGLDILVVERNPRPGGTSREFAVEGFSFPCGPLGFSDIGRFAEATGLEDEYGPSAFRRTGFAVRAPGLEALISLPFDELVLELGRLFPGERQGVEEFFAAAAAAVSTLHSTPEGQAPRFREGLDSPVSRVLAGLVRDPGLRKLLGSMGTCEPAGGFPLVARMWDLMSNAGIWYPEGGFDRIARRLASRVESFGGELRFGRPVTGIKVEGGRATGVRLADGSSVDSEAVISNSDFRRTFLDMIDRRSLPPEWRSAVASARMTSSSLQVSLGLNVSSVDLSAFDEASRIIYRRPEPSAAPDWRSEWVEPADLAGQELELALWDSGKEGLAPPGRAALVIRVPADHPHFARFSLLPSMRTSEYEYYKASLGSALVSEVERVLPGLRKATVVMDVATPLTFAEWSMRPLGSVAGWSQRGEDMRDHTVRPLVRTPVRGLFMAGHQAYSWLYHGGVTSAVLSGAEAARSVLRGEDPVTGVTIP